MIESLPLSHTQKMISTQDAGPARGRWETLLGQGTQLRRQGPGPMLTRATSERFLTTPTQDSKLLLWIMMQDYGHLQK